MAPYFPFSHHSKIMLQTQCVTRKTQCVHKKAQERQAMAIRQGWKEVKSEFSVGVFLLSDYANTMDADGRIQKQMGHIVKHISVWSDTRRSLHPIRAEQEVQPD